MATPTRATTTTVTVTTTVATRAVIRRVRPSRAANTRARSLADDARAQGAALDGVDGAWISGMVRFWLDEEWERGAVINRAIGDAVAASYLARVEAMDVATESEPMQRLVFGMAEDLLTFDFSDSFVSAFEVSNKVIEMLMLRAGVDVCCVSEEDLTRAERYEESLRAGSTD